MSNFMSYEDATTVLTAYAEKIGKWSSAVSCLVGDTTCTITDSAILSTSIIVDFCENSSGTKIAVTQIDVTTGQAVLHFDALEEATSFKLHIINL